jgi:hypothetical protein
MVVRAQSAHCFAKKRDTGYHVQGPWETEAMKRTAVFDPLMCLSFSSLSSSCVETGQPF